MAFMLSCFLAGPAFAIEWPADNLAWDGTPVDLSFLNQAEIPAGKHGFLGVREERLIFADGTPVRFWGTNLTSYALFGTTPENVRRQAHRLSALGFNLVRFHHHDSPWVDPNIFGAADRGDTQALSDTMLERLDWWIKCLKDEGIYVWLDLHAGRKFKAGDGIDGFDEMRKGKPTADLKGYSYVNLSIRKTMQRFNEQYLKHVNRYTGLSYKDEPAIAALLVTNENDITHHYGNTLLPDKNVPQHAAYFVREADAFAAAQGLSASQTRRSWEHGPAKLFLNDLEHRFHADMIAHLRQLGVKVPIAATSTWGDNPLSSRPALTAGNIIDAHAYGGAGELTKNPLHAPNMMHWLAAGQVAGMPFTVTEWNVEPFPVADRHAMPLYIAAAASLQGWDAVMHYAYAQAPLNGPGYPSNWHAYNDPALMATLPAAALLYRRGDVQEAATVYAFAPSKDLLFGRSISPKNSVALRTAAEKGKLVIVLPPAVELPWLKASLVPPGARIITDPQQSLLDAGAAEGVSDSGELRRNWQRGTYTIDAPRTQAATGEIGERAIELADVRIESGTPNASVCVQSLDGKPIARSHRILVSFGARSVPKTAKQLPFYSEPMKGRISIRAPLGLLAQAAGRKTQRLPAPYTGGRYQIPLDQVTGTSWILLAK